MNISTGTLSQKGSFPTIQHGELIVQLGSCFSTNMTFWFRRAGFSILDNPLGVIFHPIPLANQILMAFGEKELSEFVQKDDVFVSYDASSTCYALSGKDLHDLLIRQLNDLKTKLQKAGLLVITLGSAHGYRLNETGNLAANCHQQPQTKFSKELSSAEEMFEAWEPALKLLQAENPTLRVVFTVSPVRYIRDGLMENSLSKSELFRLVSLLKKYPVHYFPAYELVNDVLRDYRYFETDGVHPNGQATAFVWDFLRTELFPEETNVLIDELFKLRKMEEHRVLYPESQKAQEYQKHLEQKRESFLSQYPVVVW